MSIAKINPKTDGVKLDAVGCAGFTITAKNPYGYDNFLRAPYRNVSEDEAIERFKKDHPDYTEFEVTPFSYTVGEVRDIMENALKMAKKGRNKT